MVVAGMTSAWFLVAMTLQRMVTVLWPHKSGEICTPKSSWIVIAFIVLFSLFFNIPMILKYHYNHVLARCETYFTNSVIEWIYYNIYHWLDMVLVSLMPFVVLVISNIALIYTVFVSTQISRSMTSQAPRRKTSFLTITL